MSWPIGRRDRSTTQTATHPSLNLQIDKSKSQLTIQKKSHTQNVHTHKHHRPQTASSTRRVRVRACRRRWRVGAVHWRRARGGGGARRRGRGRPLIPLATRRSSADTAAAQPTRVRSRHNYTCVVPLFATTPHHRDLAPVSGSRGWYTCAKGALFSSAKPRARSDRFSTCGNLKCIDFDRARLAAF